MFCMSVLILGLNILRFIIIIIIMINIIVLNRRTFQFLVYLVSAIKTSNTVTSTLKMFNLNAFLLHLIGSFFQNVLCKFTLHHLAFFLPLHGRTTLKKNLPV